MIELFKEGGFVMFPILAIGLVLLGSAGRYAFDREPARLRFLGALSLALLAFMAQGMLTDFATVMWAIADESRCPAAQRLPNLLQNLKESSMPGVLGLGLLALSLTLVAIGVYRTGLRELRAARG